MKRPTIGDIAKRAGVSIGAVSYALNNQPGVSETTRARILAIAEEIGWQPSFAARSLSVSRANAVGLVLARPARLLGVEPFFMQFISGLEAELASRSVALLLQVVEDHDHAIEAFRRWWGERRIDGVIVMDLFHQDSRIPVLELLRMPAVVVGGPEGAGSLPCVWSNDAAAVAGAVDYLVALGHRDIARVAGLSGLEHTVTRSHAFEAATSRHGLEHATVILTDYSGEQGARATRSLLSGRRPPTAIIYDNDVMAVAALGVTAEMGVSVPDDLSIIAGDDSALCRLVHPSLTALARDISAYGGHTARTLLKVIDGVEVSSVEDHVAYLVPRASTAPPRGARGAVSELEAGVAGA
jgi:DNA-binding LacI/PurR family transcriptional regulator